jgi:tryptophanyl-tRNA synthetase
MKKIALTGIKPTGPPHIGNYLGMIKPALALVKEYQALYFIADYHALTTIKNTEILKGLTYEVAATWLALGLDPDDVIFFRQSDIPEIFEFTWVLSCFTSKGLLNRVNANRLAGKNPDDNINTGLFNYPVLMAADILLYGTQVVPIGLDQKQHVEIARDIANTINNSYGTFFKIPEPLIKNQVMTIPGLDGRKMSKNYKNTIPIFAEPEVMRKSVMRIVTDSKRPQGPKNPDECNVYAIYKQFASPDVFELLEEIFHSPRENYERLLEDRPYLERTLARGAENARAIGTPIMEEIRRKVGVR